MRNVKHQRFEVHIAEPQAKIPVEQALDDRFEARLVFAGKFDEPKPNHIVYQPVNVALDNVKEGIDKVRLEFHIQPPNHAEVEERQPPVSHHSQVARVRIGVKETVFQKLLQVCARQQLYDFVRIPARGRQLLTVRHLQAVDKLHHDHPLR